MLCCFPQHALHQGKICWARRDVMFQPLLMTKTNVLLVMYGDINDSSSFGSLVICNIQCIPIIQGSGRQQKTNWDGQVLNEEAEP